MLDPVTPGIIQTRTHHIPLLFPDVGHIALNEPGLQVLQPKVNALQHIGAIEIHGGYPIVQQSNGTHLTIEHLIGRLVPLHQRIELFVISPAKLRIGRNDLQTGIPDGFLEFGVHVDQRPAVFLQSLLETLELLFDLLQGHFFRMQVSKIGASDGLLHSPLEFCEHLLKFGERSADLDRVESPLQDAQVLVQHLREVLEPKHQPAHRGIGISDASARCPRRTGSLANGIRLPSTSSAVFLRVLCHCTKPADDQQHASRHELHQMALRHLSDFGGKLDFFSGIEGR